MRAVLAVAFRVVSAVLMGAIIAIGVARADNARDIVTIDFPTEIDKAISAPEQFAIAIPYESGPLTRGAWTSSGNTRTWHWEVQVPEAVSLSFHASRVSLPAGASLNVTGGNMEYSYGASSIHHGELWSRIARGDTLSFDLTVNAADAGAVRVDIVSLQAGFRSLGGRGPNHPFYDSVVHPAQTDAGPTSCVVNFQCEITAGDVGPGQASVALVVGGTYQCSGVLLNDVPGDGAPYVLTARHCENGDANGGDPGAAGSVTLYFDATSPCGQPLGDLYDAATYTMGGATTIVEQQDTWLIRLYDSVAVPNAYFAGWDATGSGLAGGYTAHYGLGNDRQYAGWFGDAYYAVVPASDLGVLFTSTFWELVNAVGSVSPGASGSGVFNNSNRLVGTLARAKLQGTGENSPGVCPVANPPIPSPSSATAEATALSGVFSSTADSQSTTGSVTLRSVLDPQNTGTKVVNGTWTPPAIATSVSAANTGSIIAISWKTIAGTSCSASGGQAGDGWGGSLATSGSQSLTEYTGGETTYIVTCYKGSLQASNRVTVNWTLVAPAVSLTIDSSHGVYYTGFIGTAELAWSATVSPCVASGGSPGDGWSGSFAAFGAATITETVAGTYTYVMTCGTGSRVATTQFSLKFSAPTAALATPGNISTANAGATVTLEATGAGAKCTTGGGASGDGWAGVSGFVNNSFGAYTAQVTEPTPGSYTYTLTCSVSGQTVTATKTITFVSGPPLVTLSTPSVSPSLGHIMPLTWVATVQPCRVAVGGPVNEMSDYIPGYRGSFWDEQYLIGTYTYTVTCEGSGTSASATATIDWEYAPQATAKTAALATLVGTPQIISWNTNVLPCTATGGSLGDGWSGSFTQAQGSVTVTETAPGNYIYGVSCGTAGQTASGAVSMTVNAGPAQATLSASSPSSSTIGGLGPMLSWNSNTSPCFRSGTSGYWGGASVNANIGNAVVFESAPGVYTYVIECGVSPNIAKAQVMITFTGPSYGTLTASNPYPAAGQPFTLSWRSGGSSTCMAGGGWSNDGWAGLHPASGSMQVIEPISGEVDFSMTCGGNSSFGASVMVLPQSLSAPTFDFESGQLTLPSLVIGNAIYGNVVVPLIGMEPENGDSSSLAPDPPNIAPFYDPVAQALYISNLTYGSATLSNIVATVGPVKSIGSVVGGDSFDGSKLTIPAVQVLGGPVHNNVVATVSSVVSVGGGTPTATRDQFDPSNRQLLIPVVTSAGHIYTNVTIVVGAVASVGD